VGQKLFKILLFPLLYLFSLLPFFILYLISSVFFLLVYYLFRYRRVVVLENLQRSFPEKDEKELKKISRQFYLHFCDVFFETLKLLSIRPATFKDHCRMDEASQAVFRKYFDQKRTVIGVMGHCGNWEWGAIAHQLYFERMITGVYHPLSNKTMDAFMLKLRSRFGGDIIPMSSLYKRLLTLKKSGRDTTIGLIADQTPPPESAYWTTFLNQDTGVFNGTEKLARKFNYPVLFMNIKKIRRGYYQLSVTELCSEPAEMPEGAISELHTRQLEKNIREQPSTWLWTHRRWKHQRPS
jgi:Kdo2-lipid IVA lauroyltransferase/acyltransferase